jgi:hypothetical protein
MAAQTPSEASTRLSETAAQTVSAATAAVQERVASLPEVIGRYPLPSLVIGVGLGYLLTPRRRARWAPEASWSQSLGDAWQATQETLTTAGQGVARNVAETTSGVADQARTLAASATEQAREATTALGCRLGPMMQEGLEAVPALGQRYPVTTLLLAAGLGYWLGTRSQR